MKLMVRPWKSMVGRLLFGMPFTTNQRRDLLQGGVFVQRIRSSCEKLNSLTVRSRMPSSYNLSWVPVATCAHDFFLQQDPCCRLFLVDWLRSKPASWNPAGGVVSPQWKSLISLKPAVADAPGTAIFVQSTWSYAIGSIHRRNIFTQPILPCSCGHVLPFLWVIFSIHSAHLGLPLLLKGVVLALLPGVECMLTDEGTFCLPPKAMGHVAVWEWQKT